MQSKPSDKAAVIATIDPVDANNADSETDVIDMSKWHEVLFIVMVGAIASSGTFDFKLQESDNSDGSSASDISGKSITQLTDADDNKQVLINLRSEECSKRYVKGVMANSAHSQLAAVVALGMEPRVGPASDDDLSSVDEIVG
jgi:hypothetical protein